VALAASATPPPSNLSCKYEIKRNCTLGSVELELKDGRIQRIDFGNFYCPAHGEIGFTCSIDVSRGDKNTKWTDKGGSSTIEFSGADNSPDGNSLTISRVRNGVVIDMRNTSSYGRCGAGAELPERIFVPARSKKCEVKLRD